MRRWKLGYGGLAGLQGPAPPDGQYRARSQFQGSAAQARRHERRPRLVGTAGQRRTAAQADHDPAARADWETAWPADVVSSSRSQAGRCHGLVASRPPDALAGHRRPCWGSTIDFDMPTREAHRCRAGRTNHCIPCACAASIDDTILAIPWAIRRRRCAFQWRPRRYLQPLRRAGPTLPRVAQCRCQRSGTGRIRATDLEESRSGEAANLAVSFDDQGRADRGATVASTCRASMAPAIASVSMDAPLSLKKAIWNLLIFQACI